jgi:hypothetical protein
MNPLEKIERAIGKVLRPQTGQTLEPIEIRREALREIADQVQPAGGGEYIFPFTAVHVDLYAADETQQSQLEAIFAMPGFAEDVKSGIADRGCPRPPLSIEVEIKTEDSTVPYRIQYQRSTKQGPKPAAPRPPARLVVIEGQAETNELVIDRDLIYIGRLKQVIHSRSGLERQNQLAFDESESSVSRKHARIEYDAASGRFRVFNDPAITSVSRDGRGIPCDATRGLQLRSGDELILGKARVRFEIDPNP